MTELYKYLTSISPIRNETWNKVKELFNETTLKKGEYFIKEGEIANKIGFLNNGVIKRYKPLKIFTILTKKTKIISRHATKHFCS